MPHNIIMSKVNVVMDIITNKACMLQGVILNMQRCAYTILHNEFEDNFIRREVGVIEDSSHTRHTVKSQKHKFKVLHLYHTGACLEGDHQKFFCLDKTKIKLLKTSFALPNFLFKTKIIDTCYSEYM